MQFQKISGDVGIRQERPERGIMRRGRCGVFFLLTVPPGEMSERILPPAQADGKG
ncbi:hypothetical protein ACK17M_23155 [Escherichia coli]|uniref:hypothetical protein n=1 Tax=Escherichia coli TaxID=562 RepID=UPI00390C2AC3